MKDKIFVLKISLDKKIYRIIEIEGGKSLYNLASAIVKAFGFDFDHAFGFYNNLKNQYDSDEIYELFIDMEGPEPGKKGVKKVKICDVFEPKKKMLFLFDYGDDWMFLVECKDLLDPTTKAKYPKVIEMVGKAPEQYPECEE
jgi:hypothetical protein